jgi:diguanylate cyclase (GGDEF)-like protein
MVSFAMPSAARHRRLLIACAIGLYGVIFLAFVVFEVPGLGIGHFYYIPVALVALGAGTWAGIGGGLLAACLYVASIFVTPRVPSHDALTGATVIRTITYCSCGALIGWFANQHREHVRQLRELAERDFLTGLLNTRAFDEVLARRCAADTPFVLVLGDIDDLKNVNDTHGHPEGNRVLQHVAETFTGAVGPRDNLARVGGDEFAVLMEGSVDEAHALVTLLKKRLARDGYELSFGFAARPEDGPGPLELFRKADDRLYAAKLLGRNRRAVLALAAATTQQ